MLYSGVAERWVNIRLFIYNEKYRTTQVIMVTWVTKKKGLKTLSPKAYGNLEK